MTPQFHRWSSSNYILRKHLDDVPLWRGDHVEVRQLVDDFARYLYLPRVAGPEVVVDSARNGVNLLTWETETFAVAEGYDSAKSRYRALQAGKMVPINADSAGLLVKPDTARKQFDAEAAARGADGSIATTTGTHATLGVSHSAAGGNTAAGTSKVPQLPRRFHGTVQLDPARVGRDAGRIAEEVIAHLAGQVGAEVTVSLDISAVLPDGASEQLQRTVTENARALKFRPGGGFETT